jgi:hypothetical protein
VFEKFAGIPDQISFVMSGRGYVKYIDMGKKY